jgi:hypothetical protein
MNKLTLANGACYTLIAAATPWAQFLGSSQEVSARMLAATAIASIVAGATAFKAFLSTSVADVRNSPSTGGSAGSPSFDSGPSAPSTSSGPSAK